MAQKKQGEQNMRIRRRHRQRAPSGDSNSSHPFLLDGLDDDELLHPRRELFDIRLRESLVLALDDELDVELDATSQGLGHSAGL